MNPVVESILIFSNLKQTVPYVFTAKIPMQTLTDFYCYLYSVSTVVLRQHLLF